MSIREAYNEWSQQYDSNENKTRDLEAMALRECLAGTRFNACLEIGCGTGKNTEWLASRCTRLLGVDFSPGMLERARTRKMPDHVSFLQADIQEDWHFGNEKFDLVSFSLVLEHIRDLGTVFEKTSQVLVNGGHVYVGELHPARQYLGSRASYETAEGKKELEAYTHHLSDYFSAARNAGLRLEMLKEYFVPGSEVPRLLVLVFVQRTENREQSLENNENVAL